MTPTARTLLTLAAALLAAPALAHDHDHPHPAQDPHAHCHEMAAAAPRRTVRSEVDVTLPAVELVRADGERVALAPELDDGRAVVVSFVFTTCTTICPVTSKILSQLQAKLGRDRARVHLASISIDPEQDTPARLAEYARRFGARAGWDHYTGTVEASVAVQRAFHAYRGDKMDHTPVTFLRLAPGQRWVRLDGFATADELAGELRARVAAR